MMNWFVCAELKRQLKRTYVDAGVLIAAARGTTALIRALEILAEAETSEKLDLA